MLACECNPTVSGGQGCSDPVAQMGSGVGPDQLVTDSFHYPEALILPGTFKQRRFTICT